MTIEELARIIEDMGGHAPFDGICKAIGAKWGMYVEGFHRSAFERVLASNPEIVHFDSETNEWILGAFSSLEHKRTKVPSSSRTGILICNIAYMKRYQGVTEDDTMTGGGKYPTQHGDGGEKYNFKPDENGVVRGFVETLYTDMKNHMGDINYARNISIENINPSFRGVDVATGVRVIFISKGPKNERNVVVGWYDDAKVYRKRQMISIDGREEFGFNLECHAENAHLIPPEQRTFEYPKKNPDGSCNFGQSNLSYPASKKNQYTTDLLNRLLEYIDDFGKPRSRFFINTTIVTTWNYFEKKGRVGDTEVFTATQDMQIGDFLLIYVGKKGNARDAGIYALAKIVTNPEIYESDKSDYCYGKLAVKGSYIQLSDDPIIAYEKTLEIAKQVRSPHMIGENHYRELASIFGITN